MQNRYRRLLLMANVLWVVVGGAEHALALTFTEFPIPTASTDPFGITTGPDGALWFVEEFANKIGRIATAGVITEFPAGSPFSITTGPDGALWFTEDGSSAAVILRGLPLLVAASPQQVSLAQQSPELIEIVPASGPAGEAYPLQATIRGTGFLPAGNVVEFGPVKIPDLSSAGGVRITFSVPKLVPSKGEVPPMVLAEGDYRVTVTTSSGTSNALMFKLTRGP